MSRMTGRKSHWASPASSLSHSTGQKLYCRVKPSEPVPPTPEETGGGGGAGEGAGVGGLGGAGGVTVPGDCEGPLTGQDQAAHYQQQVEQLTWPHCHLQSFRKFPSSPSSTRRRVAMSATRTPCLTWSTARGSWRGWRSRRWASPGGLTGPSGGTTPPGWRPEGESARLRHNLWGNWRSWKEQPDIYPDLSQSCLRCWQYWLIPSWLAPSHVQLVLLEPAGQSGGKILNLIKLNWSGTGWPSSTSTSSSSRRGSTGAGASPSSSSSGTEWRPAGSRWTSTPWHTSTVASFRSVLCGRYCARLLNWQLNVAIVAGNIAVQQETLYHYNYSVKQISNLQTRAASLSSVRNLTLSNISISAGDNATSPKCYW